MLICSNCQSRQYDGTVFCTECGATVLEFEQRPETTFALHNNVPQSASTEKPAPSRATTAAAQTIVRLTVVHSGRCIELSPSQPLLVGRRDAARGVYPDVDLSNDGGYDAGVSRRHARLRYQHNGYVVEDLQSANGTFVNGSRVAPDTPAVVRSGDELGFGSLVLRIELG